MATTPVRFDDSLPLLAEAVAAELGEEALAAGTVLRDAAGRLAFFAATSLDQEGVGRLGRRLRAALGVYARTDRVVASADDYGAMTVRADPSALHVRAEGRLIRLVDRRLVGADWLRAPSPPAPPPPRFVFASLKGGVGRSTALAVMAAHLAAHGGRVLAVDLDMEAPGLGALLLTQETLPEYGVVDALVEGGLATVDAPLDDRFYADLVGPSALADRRGRIDVIPAFGSRAVRHPADALAKLARAYAETPRPDGTVATTLDQVRALIDRFAQPSRYDAILLDARAGLHETTAAAVLGLGAEVLLFGLDEPQTFQGYAMLLAHLARFVPAGGPDPEWLSRLTLVQGKAPTDPEERAGFRQRCLALFSEAGLGPAQPPESGEVFLPAGPSFREIPWDDDLPDEEVLPAESPLREALAVLDDARFRGFDPQRRRDLLSEGVYRATFAELLTLIAGTVLPAEVPA